MRFRKLRIAWSMAWGLACVLLIAMWVRSYWWADEVRYRPATIDGLRVWSDEGALRIERFPNLLTHMGQTLPFGWSRKKFWNAHFEGFSDIDTVGRWRKVFRGFSSARYIHLLPYWAVVFSTVACAGLPWLRWRFTLRTLLIATTLVAVGLGLIVAVLRWPAG
jgi:hypothetical protein